MTSNLKVILSAAGVAALVASPAMAKSHGRINNAVPAYASASAAPYRGRIVTPYAANLPVSGHETSGPNPDFQLGSEK